MPPKAKPEEPTTRFLFVNEDAETVTRKTKDPVLDREKQSHVQRQNFAKRQQSREQPSEQVGEGSLIRFPSASIPATGAGAATFFNPGIDPTSTLVYPLSQIPSSDVSGTSTPAEYALGFSIPGTLPSNRLAHPLFPGPDQILEKWAPPLIRHQNTVILPEKFYADTSRVPLGQTRHAMAIHADTADAMSEPVHLYAFLAAAAAQMLAREGRLLLPDVREADYQRVILFFKTKAMEHLRAALSNGVTHSLVVDMLRLITTSYFTGAYDQAVPHFDAMVAMIRQLGGIRTFGDYFEETNIILDWSAGLKHLIPPKLPTTEWDPIRGGPEIEAILDSFKSTPDTLGQRLIQIINEHGLRPGLRVPLDGLIENTRFHRWAKQQSEYNAEHYRYIVLRQTAIGCRFLGLLPEPNTTAHEEAVRIALVFWTALTRSPTSGRRCASVAIEELRTRLLATDLDGWGELDDLLLWIAIVGGLTARTDEHIDWFATLASVTAKRVGGGIFTDFEKMEKLLNGFLYEPASQREPLLDLRARMRRLDKA
jgi:hypothetical protein